MQTWTNGTTAGRRNPALDVVTARHDGFAFALAEATQGCILLTGDGQLRAMAVRHAIEVHGVLWVIDQIHANQAGGARRLHEALRALSDDGAVRLPRCELDAYLKRHKALR